MVRECAREYRREVDSVTNDSQATGIALLSRKVRSAFRLVSYKGGRAGTRAWNVSQKHVRHYGMRGQRVVRVTAEKTKNARITAVNLSRYAWRRVITLHKPFVRLWRRRERGREQQAARKFEQRVERDVRARVATGKPLILGPWFSEVGFEVLYWVPFLRWLRAEHHWDTRRVVAVSRGGVHSWYRDLADTYVELFDFMSPDEFARRDHARRGGPDGSHKQLSMSTLDREILDHARKVSGLHDAEVVHPSDMYQLFNNYWLGHRPLSYVEDRTRFSLRQPPDRFDLSGLPEHYVAVKAYTAASLPNSPLNRRVLASLVDRLTEHTNVVTLDTGLTIDDHFDYRVDKHPRVFDLGGLMTPANNLELQTQVIAGAQAYVGTCGSLTWMAPLLGVNTVALMSETRFLHQHLYLARKVYLEQGGAGFATIDVSALEHLGLQTLTTEGLKQ